jgi:hypothetical protein
MNPLGSWRPRSDRPAKTSPAAQPSVRWASRATSSAARARPMEPFSRTAASSPVNCSSAARSSASSPRARSRARESGGSSRVDSTTCTAAGSWSRNKPRVWWQIGSVIRW